MIRELILETKEPYGEPTVIFIIGGVGAGKNYIKDKKFRKIHMIDPDEHTYELAKGDYDLQRKFIGQSIEWVNAEFEKNLKKGNTFIMMGTGANFKGYVNRFQKAKDAGMTTAVVFVNTDPKQALKNNQKRIVAGGRGSTIPDYKFKTSWEKAKFTYDNIQLLDICDYAEEVKNG